MVKKRKKQAAAANAQPVSTDRLLLACGGLAVLVWSIATLAAASRIYSIMDYSILTVGAANVEPFLASGAAWLVVSLAALLWIALLCSVPERVGGPAAATVARGRWSAVCLLFISVAPAACQTILDPSASARHYYAEVLWLSGCTGMSFAVLAALLRSNWLQAASAEATPSQQRGATRLLGVPFGRRASFLLTASLAFLMAVWFYLQQLSYYDDFLLGFNDFAHFGQRVANTAAGRGILLESPVLPAFWDHFNPGLLLLVPLWWAAPTAELFFVLQAVALCAAGQFIWLLARRAGFNAIDCSAWAIAWLLQPSVGQMNLAYTYGWHPISIAIPLLLAALLALEHHRWLVALLCAVAAASFGEAVTIVVALFCFFCAAQSWMSRYPARKLPSEATEVPSPQGSLTAKWLGSLTAKWLGSLTAKWLGSPAVIWLGVSAAWFLAFFLTYHFSGLAEFQTGRFVALGDNAYEVLLSPVLRPQAFWGELLQGRKAAFVLSLLLPTFIPAVWLGWRWLLPTLLPLGILLVWDHQPAASLAFQYPSTLLPIVWFAAIQGASCRCQSHTNPQLRDEDSGRHAAIDSAGHARDQTARSLFASLLTGAPVGAASTALLLSLFVGGAPYSAPTLFDVQAQTYSTELDDRRAKGGPDNTWLQQCITQVVDDEATVLATGRAAAHLIGQPDVETVAQYLFRLPQLEQLPDRGGDALSHYRWILLDRNESFQQTPQQTAQVEAAALNKGYLVVGDQHGILLLQRPMSL